MTKNNRDITQRLDNFRAQLVKMGFDCFIIPKSDPHQTEHTLDYDNIVKFLTGFTGSAGFCAILNKHSCDTKGAAIFVDGRYKLQVENEIDKDLFDYKEYTCDAICNWIISRVPKGGKVAFDDNVVTKVMYDRINNKLMGHDIFLCPISNGYLDDLWLDRPDLFIPEISPYPIDYAGSNITNKIALIRESLSHYNADGYFINITESIAWLFNIRAHDRPYTPAASIYAYVPQEGMCTLFIHDQQQSDDLLENLQNRVGIISYDCVKDFLRRLSSNGKSIYLDRDNIPVAIVNTVEKHGGKIVYGDDLCAVPKACKNLVEIKSTKNAHIRDGAAICNLLCWLEKHMIDNCVTEMDVVNKLKEYRSKQDLYISDSFDAIAGSGSNGAIMHYRVSKESNKALQNGELFLLDSGGQYLDGTTDITRTIALGKQATIEQKDRFTRVLKGHIALANAYFPAGTTGTQLDVLARKYLWDVGCDYEHGTGHGVGVYLGVHEGPQRINKASNTYPLMEGMILSNEPGYYKTGEYGIRIESLIVVKKAPVEMCFEREMLCFETITFVPIDLSLIDFSLMSSFEKRWLNNYHKKVYEILSTQVTSESLPWLKEATKEV